MNAQTVTVDDPTLGALATYTFTYVTSQDTGVGTNTSNLFHTIGKPSGYISYKSISPFTAESAVVKVNGVVMPWDGTVFNKQFTASWGNGVQIGGMQTTIPAGSTIEVSVSKSITNPSTAAAYTFEWSTQTDPGVIVEYFSAVIDFSALSVEDITLNNKNISIFPNPTSNFIQVSGLTKTEKYKLYNILGTEISNGLISNREKINIQSLSNGMYFLKFEEGQSLKIIKK